MIKWVVDEFETLIIFLKNFILMISSSSNFQLYFCSTHRLEMENDYLHVAFKTKKLLLVTWHVVKQDVTKTKLSVLSFSSGSFNDLEIIIYGLFL